ncbi:hypothetical protein TNCV_1988611 [Trichonephila clavipes]|nr:hypothetical protein TNCV_1988611 [Trichonephila clavipes]
MAWKMTPRASVLFDYLTVSLEEFVAIDDDNVSTTPMIAYKHILKFVQSSEYIIDADSSDGNETNHAAASEMRNIMKSMRSYLDAHSNGEMNKKVDDIEQFEAKKDNAKKKI